MAPSVRLTSPEHCFDVIAGRRLHHLDYGGDGEPVVLLHGVGGTAWVWHAVAPLLAATHRVVSVDLRGFGLSERSPEHAYSTDELAGDVIELLDRRGLGLPALVGFSWGALVALAVATRRPVRRVTIVDLAPSSPLGETDVAALPYRSTSHEAAVAQERALAPRATAEMLERTVSLLTVPATDGSSALVRAIDPFFLDRWPFRSDDRWAELAAVTVPVLVVRGGESPVLPADIAARMATTAPDGRLVTIPDCGHLVPVEQPGPLAAAVAAFLAAS